MMRNRILSLATLLLLTSVVVLAQGYDFVVWANSGEQICFPLSEKPKVTHNGDKFIVSSEVTSIEYSVADLKKFTLATQDPGAVEIVELPESNLLQRDNELILKGFKVGSAVKIYSVNGQLLLTKLIDDSAFVTIDLSPLSKGIYIVSTESITCKIIKQ